MDTVATLRKPHGHFSGIFADANLLRRIINSMYQDFQSSPLQDRDVKTKHQDHCLYRYAIFIAYKKNIFNNIMMIRHVANKINASIQHMRDIAKAREKIADLLNRASLSRQMTRNQFYHHDARLP